jgi:hypothetical protein
MKKTRKHVLVNEYLSLILKDSKAEVSLKSGSSHNLDPHYKSGSHWVANYIDLDKHCCYYFDSYGMETPKQIEKFMQFLTLQDPRMKLAYNARRFQFQGT